MVEHLRFGGSIREVTVNRTAGTWFACFAMEDGQLAPPVKDGPSIGVDVGINPWQRAPTAGWWKTPGPWGLP